MKKTIYISCLAAGLSLLGACDGDQYDLENLVPQQYHKILNLNNSGKQSVTLYNTDEDGIYTFAVMKNGSDPSLTASADIRVLTQEEVDGKYSSLEGVDYKVIPAEAYKLDATHVDFASGETAKTVHISLNPQKIKAVMTASPESVCVMPVRVVSESDSVNSARNELLLQITDVITPTVGFVTAGLEAAEYTYGSVPDIEKKAAFALDTDNKWDLTCHFAYKADYITEYNAANGSEYQPLPDGTYSFDQEAALPSSATQADLNIKVQGGSLPMGDYMLPVCISQISQFELSADKNVYAMGLRIKGAELDRTGWTATASTEEAVKEGEGNGVAGCMLDGNLDTYWHSQYDGAGANPPLPHTVVIDTKSEHSFSHFAMTHRRDYYYTKAGEFYTSNDNSSWTKVGQFSMKQENGTQLFGLKKGSKGRYIKIVVTESNNGVNATIAEFYAYGK